MAIVATSGILLGAVYYLWTFQSVFFGKFWIRKGITWKEGLYDLDTREKLILIPLAVLAVVFGLFPSILLDAISADLRTLVGDILTKR